MHPPRRHLLLPSDKGLVHYDLLEETAFLGTGPRGAIMASPTPFPEAKIVLSDDGRGFIARPMPGEPPPEVNGAPGVDVRLTDGARIRVGEQVALFRSPEVATVPAESSAWSGVSAGPRVHRHPSVPAVPKSAGSAAKLLVYIGAALLVFSAYQTVRYLDTKRADPVPPITASMFEDPPVVRSTPEESARREFDRLAAFDNGDVNRLKELYEGYAQLAKNDAQYAKNGRGTAAGERAAMRLRELRPKLAAFVWKETSQEVEHSARASRFRTAIGLLEGFEARFFGTETALAATDRLVSVRAEARGALDALAERAAPLIAKDPTRAYRLLTTSMIELPPDLAEELAALMARVRDGWGAPVSAPLPKPIVGLSPMPDPPPTPAPGPAPAPAPTDPGEPGGAFKGRPQHGPKKTPGAAPPPTPAVDTSSAAKALWVMAREHLAGRRFQEARDAYTQLLRDYATSEPVKAHPERIKAGRKAADLGLRGPVALLKEEATINNGRLECEWSFDDDASFLEDFTLDQVFPAVEPAECAIRSGQAILSGSTSILVNVVFEPGSVFVEADCVADTHRDYGLVARQEDRNAQRSVLLDVGNTQFKLKKGADGKVLGGHVLWLFGEGVWKDADKGESGFIRLAEQLGNTLKSGERLRLTLEMLGDKVEGAIHSKTDPANMKGPLKGDDGKGIGPVKVGAFAYKGRVGIERLKISGKVDESWALEEFQRLSKADTGPE